MKLSHTYAGHSCFKCKKYSWTSNGSPNWSLAYLLLASGMAAPLWVFLVLIERSLPWSLGFGVFAGELLLFYVGSFVGGLAAMFRNRAPSVCPECGAPLTLVGRYFHDRGKAGFEDYVLVGVFLVSNVALWITLLLR